MSNYRKTKYNVSHCPKCKTRDWCKEDKKNKEFESTTPPLPAKTSIENLIKKRKALKRELDKFSDTGFNSKTTVSNVYKNCKYSKSDCCHKIYSNCKDSNEHEILIKDKKKAIVEPSSETNGDCMQVESEDEESVIERIRQQRKQLLEKFNVSGKEKQEKKEDSTEFNKHYAPSDKDISEISTGMTKNYVKFNSDIETTDMFSDKYDTVPKNVELITQDNNVENISLADNWDDADGYYNIKLGDILNNKYTIKSILGQGVFSNVIQAQENGTCKQVAIKIIRNNDLMLKNGWKEITVLKEIADADPENKNHCVKILSNFLHKTHLCIVLECLFMDLRSVIKKYGKHHGLNIKALVTYSRQLLVALKHLKKLGIIHADIKPDNILVNEKKNVLKLCDFGSATRINESECTPYLVSRFYRAPEIILGIPFKYGVDIWSAACTMFEMATGKIMFAGSSNNKMLKTFMDLKGKFSIKTLKKGKFKDQHFNYNYNFLLHKRDEFSGREKVIEISNINITRDIQRDLQKYCYYLNKDEDKKIMQLKDILDKMLMLDHNQRLSILDCLRHPFIREDLRK